MNRVLWILIPVAVVAAIFLGITNFFSHATLILIRDKNVQTDNVQFSIDVNSFESDFSQKTIAPQIISFSEQLVKSYPATGSRLMTKQKSQGTVEIRNIGRSFALAKSSSFLSKDGKTFLLSKNTTVPSGTPQKPSKVNVNLVASDFGAAFNLSPTTFTVPKLSSAYAKNITVTSYQQFKGGADEGTATVITSEDAVKAKDDFRNSLEKQLREQLAKQFPGGEFYDALLNMNFSVGNPIPDVSEVAEQFRIEGQGIVRAFVLLNGELMRGVRAVLLSEIPDDTLLNEVEIKNVSASDLDFDSGTGNLYADVSYSTSVRVDEAMVKSKIASKSFKEAENYLNSIKGIVKSYVSVWPSWVSRIPSDSNSITFEYR